MIEFGEQLRIAREEKGMTQQTLADKLYVARQTVSRWECGDRYPDLITVKKISEILEISVDKLLSDNEICMIAEKAPLINKGIVNQMMVILYAVISFSLLVTLTDIMIRFPLESNQIDYSNIRDIQVIIVNCLGLVVQIGIFIFGFIEALRGTLSPKKSGIIAMLYFFSVCLADMNQMIGNMGLQMVIRVLLSMIPSIFGGIASFLYFCKAKNPCINGKIIVIVSVWESIIKIANTGMIIQYGKSLSMNIALNLILKLCIFILIIYQVYALKKKRNVNIIYKLPTR